MTCYRNEVDGKIRLPLYAQWLVLEALGDSLGQQYIREWPKMKTLFDAADHGILGGGFEPIKPERFHQLYELVLKLTGTMPSDLPEFPVLHLP